MINTRKIVCFDLLGSWDYTNQFKTNIYKCFCIYRLNNPRLPFDVPMNARSNRNRRCCQSRPDCPSPYLLCLYRSIRNCLLYRHRNAIEVLWNKPFFLLLIF